MVQGLGDIHNYKIVMRVNEEPHQTAQTERLNSYICLAVLGIFNRYQLGL